MHPFPHPSLAADRVAGGLHSHGGHDSPSSPSSSSDGGVGYSGRHRAGGGDGGSKLADSAGCIDGSGIGGNGAGGGPVGTPIINGGGEVVGVLTAGGANGGGGAGGGGGAVPLSSAAASSAASPSSSFVSDTAAKSKSALAGLIVHAMVDGMALAAAVKEGDSALGFLVFAAIMLHKAPGAFGMTSYLLHAGIGRAGVRSRLVLFSLAAPTGALLTYWLLSLNLFVYHSESVALCLLFSGGTFLYVATAHVLPEITNCACREGGGGGQQWRCGKGWLLATCARPASQALHDPSPPLAHARSSVAADAHLRTHDDDDHHHHHGSGAAKKHKHSHGMRWAEVWTLVAGVLLPLFINVGHGH